MHFNSMPCRLLAGQHHARYLLFLPCVRHHCAGEDDDMPLAAAAATKKMPSDKQLVMSVEEILAGEDVQSFALSALMKRLRERRAVAVPALLLTRKLCIG